MTKGEGAEMGEFVFTADPIEDGVAILCVMTTKTHVLKVKCLPGRDKDMLLKMIKEAKDA